MKFLIRFRFLLVVFLFVGGDIHLTTIYADKLKLVFINKSQALFRVTPIDWRGWQGWSCTEVGRNGVLIPETSGECTINLIPGVQEQAVDILITAMYGGRNTLGNPSGEKKYYFAMYKNGNNYNWEQISHLEIDNAKNFLVLKPRIDPPGKVSQCSLGAGDCDRQVTYTILLNPIPI